MSVADHGRSAQGWGIIAAGAGATQGIIDRQHRLRAARTGDAESTRIAAGFGGGGIGSRHFYRWDHFSAQWNEVTAEFFPIVVRQFFGNGGIAVPNPVAIVHQDLDGRCGSKWVGHFEDGFKGTFAIHKRQIPGAFDGGIGRVASPGIKFKITRACSWPGDDQVFVVAVFFNAANAASTQVKENGGAKSSRAAGATATIQDRGEIGDGYNQGFGAGSSWFNRSTEGHISGSSIRRKSQTFDVEANAAYSFRNNRGSSTGL